MTQWSEHLLDIFLHLTGTGNLIIPVILFFFSVPLLNVTPRDLGSAFSHFSHTTELGKILATEY